jgi:hypothetical protein
LEPVQAALVLPARNLAKQTLRRQGGSIRLPVQAPAFYEKRGYVRVGVVDDYRGGVQRIFMQKRLHT